TAVAQNIKKLAMLLSRAGKGGFKFIWVDIHPLIVYIPFIYKNPAINKVDSQGLSTFSEWQY
ncbi:hypothetical protein, partial [Laceyella putida]